MLNSSRAKFSLLMLLLFSAAVDSQQPASSSLNDATDRETRFTFSELGVESMSLRGVESAAGLNFGIRRDQLVDGGVIHLRMTYSPSLIADLSHLRVNLNGQTITALPLTKADAGHEVERSIPLDARYFSDYNHIQLDLIAHYTAECEDPQHSSLWVKVSGASDLSLDVRPLQLPNDLSLLPAPFFDPHDNRRLVLPIVLPAKPSLGIVRSAGVVASWFGMLADYRGARFPVSFNSAPKAHALVFATNDSRPVGLSLKPVEAPTISIIDHPDDPSVKLLVFQGRDEIQLRQAVEGAVIGNPVFAGSSATVEKVSVARRIAYDAPRWVRGDRAVRLSELIDDPSQLQGYGITPPPMAVSFRLPPDLFTWNKVGIPLSIHYRYTAPAERDNSLLTVSVNQQLLRTYRLRPESELSDSRLSFPLLQSDSSRVRRELFIPAFELTSANQLAFQFSMDLRREGNCKEVFTDSTRESIDPDSTINISSFPHYTELPNLALFANAGFPFTRYADLAEAGVVLEDTSDGAALQQLFFVLGRMGRQTGAVTTAYHLMTTGEAAAAANVDLLLLGNSASDLLERWDANLPLSFSKDGWSFRLPSRATPPAAVQLKADGALAAFLSFESPISPGRTVVAWVASDDKAAERLIETLDDNSKVPLIRGALVVVRDRSVQSFDGDKPYYVGSLRVWQWLWFHFSQHAVLFIILSLASAIAVGLLLYGGLQRLVRRRLAGQPGN